MLRRRLDLGIEDVPLESLMDATAEFGGEKLSLNLTFQPLVSLKGQRLGTMLMLEDISNEKRMKSTMSRYMDPSIAERLLESGAEILGGQSSTATILFSDIRSFTTLTEELGPQATVALLNEYFTVMVDCIQKEGGMLDKFIGDAIMAVFGTPMAHDDDEDRCLRAAINMLRSLTGFNRRRAGEGKKPVDIGIGINTDTIVSGNIGSPRRMDYTVIGDAVNVAARLESRTKEIGWPVIASRTTVDTAGAGIQTGKSVMLDLRGRNAPIEAVEIIGTDQPLPGLDSSGELPPEIREALAANAQHAANVSKSVLNETLRMITSDLSNAVNGVSPPSISGYRVISKIGQEIGRAHV